MRARTVAAVVVPAALATAIAACAHDDRRIVVGPAAPEPVPSSTHARSSQYLVADPTGSRGALALALGSGQHGLVVDRRRVVVGRGEPRIAADLAAEPLVGARRIPGRLGGGFLFWTANTIYRSDAFESSLKPVCRVPESIEAISFAPRSLLVRTRNGERWGITPSGDRAPIVPLGVADIQALDDGRALGFDHRGTVFTSVDHGVTWTDATIQMKGPPTKVSIVGHDLWLVDANGGASRLEVDGRLAWFDKPPVEPGADVRVEDPRWRGSEMPLRAVLHSGAAIDDRTAIVVDSGDLVRVDVRTGELVSVILGRLPPDALCEALPVGGDVLFACHARSGGGAFVVSHTLSSDPPIVEQAFSGGGGFFTSDDGGIAYSGSCAGIASQPSSAPVACVRLPGGRWEERDLSGLTIDGGIGDVHVARWVPRSDGRVVALVVEPAPGIYDPQAQRFQPLPEEAREAIGEGSMVVPIHGRTGRTRYRKGGGGSGLVDSSWSFVGAGVRGYQRHGEAIELTEDGRLKRSPYTLDMVWAGAFGLGRSSDGRLYQSNDHGGSWVEVAAPPSGIEAVDMVSCTNVGCDLGAFYRLGWNAEPPRADPPKAVARPAPEVRRTRGLELSCRPHGSVVSKMVPRTSDSPEDLGLGAARLQVASYKNDWAFIRSPVAWAITSPIHDPPLVDSDTTTQSLRAMFSGFGTARDGDVITVTGPNKNAMALRRGFAYAPPFDPTGRIVRTSIAMTDVVSAGRRVGMTTDEILAEDFTESGNVIAVTPSDETAPSDVAIHNIDHGLVTLVRGERVRLGLRSTQDVPYLVSGVALPGDETAFLELDSAGLGHVFKLGPAGVTDLFDVVPTANETYYPANPDALAVGPKGDLAILRTPSGSDPASSLDPAFLVVAGAPLQPLAPWSELKFADDPVCKSDRTGYRTTLQLVGPWIRVSTPELRAVDEPMLARVRWSAKRICLEGFEVKLPAVSARVPQSSGGSEPVTFSTVLVAKGSSFARIGIADGVEWRQALDCTVAASGP